MTPSEINDIANWIALSAAIPFLGYWLTYGLGSPWYKSWLGTVMFGLGASCALLLTFVTIRRMFGDFPGYEWWAIGLYSLFTLEGWALWAIVLIERRRAGLMLIPLKRKDAFMSEVKIDTTSVPDIWYKAQRVLRTGVNALLTLLTAWAAIALVAPQILEELAKILPESWIVWIAGTIASITAVQMVLTRIMALPKVNAWLTKWLNLGSVPRNKILPPASVVVPESAVAPAHVEVVPSVIPDPKVVQPGDTRDGYRERNGGDPA